MSNRISEFSMLYLDRKAIVDDLTERLKEAQYKLTEVEQDLLPSAMDSANQTSCEIQGGITIAIKEDITMSLKAGNKERAFAWLRANQKGDLIKNIVSVEFGKGQDEHAQYLATLLKSEGFEYQQKDNANVASLKAVIRRDLEQGVDVPLQDFGAHQYRKAIVKIKS